MERFNIVLLVVAAIAPAVVPAIVADAGGSQIQAFPQLPNTFFEWVTIGGVPAEPGQVIETRIGGVNYAESVLGGVATIHTTTESDGTYGIPKNFQVAADDPRTLANKGGHWRSHHLPRQWCGGGGRPHDISGKRHN